LVSWEIIAINDLGASDLSVFCHLCR